MRFLTVFLFLAAFYSGITTDEGNGFDPHGTPRTTAARCDDGSGLDPHGGPCPNASLRSGDAGWGIDPNG